MTTPGARRPATAGGSAAVREAQRLGGQRRFAEAIATLKRHLKANRNDPEALGLLGALQADMGSGAEARKTLKKAMRLDPKSADLCCRLGRIEARDLQLDQAAKQFRAALSIDPGHLWAARCLVDVLLGQRRGEEAYTLLTGVMQSAPEAPDTLFAMAKVCQMISRPDEGLRAVEAMLKFDGLPDDARTQAMFIRGALRENLGEHDSAFDAYRDANESRASVFDAARNAAQTDRMIEVWSRDRLGAIETTARKTEQAVFIVGMPRSGTSLVEQIAASHPGVFGAGELPWIPRIVRTFNDDDADPIQFLTDPDKLSRPNIENASRHYLNKVRAMAPGADRITDKMPYNFRALGMIAKLFPEAKIVHCVRDPRDVCLSCYFLYFMGAENDFTFDLTALGSFYSDYQRLMEHWKSALDIPILDVVYEEMISDQETQSRRLIEFLGLEWDERCLEFHKTKRMTKTLSEHQVSKPIYSSSVGRWKAYEKRLGPLFDRLP